MVEFYIVLLHKVQLHVSALDDGHLGLYMKYLVSSYMGLIWAVYSGEVGTRSYMCHRGWVVWVRGGLCYYMLCLS